MEIHEIDSLELDELSSNFEEIVKLIKDDTSDYYSKVGGWIKQYEGDHAILEKPDKIIGSGNDVSVVTVAKLPIPYQKKIVRTSASFLFGEPISIISPDNVNEESFMEFKRVWNDMKLGYHDKALARKTLSETRSAELFYVVKDANDKLKIKVKLLCKSNGDDLYPYFDLKTGDLLAFMRQFIVTDKKGASVVNIEIYTSANIYTAIKGDSGWDVTSIPNLIKKIPVIYYELPEPDWAGVQEIIERVETLISNNADTNDYFGSPAIVSKGQLKSAPSKGEVGKFFEIIPYMSEGQVSYGSLEYLTWDRAPEAIKLEYEILTDLIYSQSSTPNMSFEQLKGIGAVSGIAIKLMFLDSIMKSKYYQEVFGSGIQRRINLIKEIMGKVTDIKHESLVELLITFKFSDGIPNNEAELIDILTSGTGGKAVMTVDTAVKNNPFVSNPVDEAAALQAEEDKNSNLGESFG